MKESIRWLGFLILCFLGFYGAYLFAERQSTTIMILFFFYLFYSSGHTTAEFVDRRRKLSNIDLPIKIRQILFLKQNNPFSKKTIIFQSILIIITPIVIIISLFVSNMRVLVINFMAYIMIMFILAFILGIQSQIGTDYHLDKSNKFKRRR